MSLRWGSLSTVFLRYGLGLGFLSAVADRLGLWGAFGQPNVEWGNFSRFLEYTHSLNWYLPAGMRTPTSFPVPSSLRRLPIKCRMC